MKRLPVSTAAVALVTLWLAAPAMAQNQPPLLSIIRSCTFINGSDANDLTMPMQTLSRWVDEHKLNLAISTLTPVFTSTEITFDVALFYVFPDASAMGRWAAAIFGPDGPRVFDNVLDCPSSTSFALNSVRSPATRNGAPLQVFNCTLKEGQNGAAARGAITKWAEATTTYETGHGMMNALAGESQEATYNFKWILAFRSWQDYGDSLAGLFSGGPSQAQIIGPVMDCDRARIYHQTFYRQMQAN